MIAQIFTLRQQLAEQGLDAGAVTIATYLKLTDNGFVFTTRHRHGPNVFETELARHGIIQKNGHPNHPQTQGKVERLNQTLKKWLRAQPAAPTLEALQAQLDRFRDHYNHHRPHRSLNNQTPHHAYTARAIDTSCDYQPPAPNQDRPKEPKT